MIRLLGGLLKQLQPIRENPFSLDLLHQCIDEFGLWECA